MGTWDFYQSNLSWFLMFRYFIFLSLLLVLAEVKAKTVPESKEEKDAGEDVAEKEGEDDENTENADADEKKDEEAEDDENKDSDKEDEKTDENAGNDESDNEKSV